MNRLRISGNRPGISIACVAVLVGSACQPRAAELETDSGLARAAAYLDQAAADSNFMGVALIARGDSIRLHEAYGWADVELRVPVRTGHSFRIGSLTKPVTASAVLVAVRRGLLSLDDAVCASVEPCPAAWQSVTIGHLLNHTSGIADHFGRLEAVPVGDTRAELRRVMEASDGDELLAEPGAQYAYSNFNYVLLGAVLEQVTGQPWEHVLRDWIFEPLALASLRYDDVYAIIEGRVRGYGADDSAGLRNIEYDDHAAYAAGGLLSTAEDLFRWSRSVWSGELLGAELTRAALTPVRGDYGYGWQVRRFFDRPIHNHTGGIDGFSSHLAHYPEEDLTIVVLSNNEDDPAILRACDMAALWFDWPLVDGATNRSSQTPRQRCGVEETS